MLGGREIGVAIALLFGLFFIAAALIPSKLLIELARIVHLSVVTAVLISYGKLGVAAFVKRKPSGSDILVMGITISFASHFLHSLWMLFWRLAGQPPWIVNSDVTALTVAMASTAGLCYLAAPGSLDGHVPPRNRLLMGTSIGAGLLMILLVFVYNVDLSPASEILKPYIYDADSFYERTTKLNGGLG